MQVQVRPKHEVLGDLASQRSAVAVQDPAVGTDERQHPVQSQQVETLLDKSDVQIRPIEERLKLLSVGVLKRPAQLLDPDVRRISYYVLEVREELRKEE